MLFNYLFYVENTLEDYNALIRTVSIFSLCASLWTGASQLCELTTSYSRLYLEESLNDCI